MHLFLMVCLQHSHLFAHVSIQMKQYCSLLPYRRAFPNEPYVTNIKPFVFVLYHPFDKIIAVLMVPGASMQGSVLLWCGMKMFMKELIKRALALKT